MRTQIGPALMFLLLLGVLTLLYASSYLCLMEQAFVYSQSGYGEPDMTWATPFPDYRLGDEWARQFFRPAHYVDQILRPEIWLPVSSPLPQ